jgi:hypothetical protein
LIDAGLDQLGAGVRNPGRPGIAHQRDGFPLPKARNKLRQTGPDVVRVKADQAVRDAVSDEKPGCAPRVLGRNERCLAQDAKRAQTDVLEIADWRGDNEESARHVGSDAVQACRKRVVIVPSGDVRSWTDETERRL